MAPQFLRTAHGATGGSPEAAARQDRERARRSTRSPPQARWSHVSRERSEAHARHQSVRHQVGPRTYHLPRAGYLPSCVIRVRQPPLAWASLVSWREVRTSSGNARKNATPPPTLPSAANRNALKLPLVYARSSRAIFCIQADPNSNIRSRDQALAMCSPPRSFAILRIAVSA